MSRLPFTFDATDDHYFVRDAEPGDYFACFSAVKLCKILHIFGRRPAGRLFRGFYVQHVQNLAHPPLCVGLGAEFAMEFTARHPHGSDFTPWAIRQFGNPGGQGASS